MSESSVSSGQDDGQSQQGNGRQRKPNVKRSNFALVGTIVVTILVVGLALGITKPEWQQYFTFGFTTREVNAPGDYFILPNSSKVKVGGVEVGRIDSVSRREDGTATYVVRVQSDVIDKVGSAPSANVRPTTLLGGVVYMDLLPGGDRTQPWNDAIPIDRTKLPVELNQVIQAVQPDAVEGIPATVQGLQGTLENGGDRALKRFAREAPGALGPGAGVINALTGNNPGADLPNVVSGLQQTTAVLARKDGQIESVLRDLRATSSALAQSSRPTQAAIRKLPATLDTATAGLARLSTTLDKLKATAPEARPTVQALDKLLQRLDPVLVEARPVVNDLRYALRETRPLVEDLVPAAKDLRYTFDTLDPSLDRVRGPVVDALESGYEPDGAPGQPVLGKEPVVSQTEYTQSEGRRHTAVAADDQPQPTLRQELAQFIRRANAVSGYNDRDGSGIAFNIGFGPGSITGIPGTPTFEQFQSLLLGILQNGGAIPGLPGSGAGVGGPLRLPVPSQLAGALPKAAAPLAEKGLPLAGRGLPLATPGTGATRAPARAPGAVRAPATATAPDRPTAPALPGTGLLTGGAR